MAKYTSGRQKNLKIGISSYSENLTSLEVIGKVGIGITNAQYSLDVVGDINFSGILREDGNQFVASRWTSGSGTDIYRLSNVGIGTNIANTRITIGGTTGLSFSDDNIRIGYANGNSYTGASITSGDRNIFIGDGAGEKTSSGSYNTFLGTQAGRNNQTGSFNLFLGHEAGVSLGSGSGDSNIIIGHNVSNLPIPGGSNQLVIGFGNTSWITGNNSGNVGIGTTNPSSKLDVNGNTKITGTVTLVGIGTLGSNGIGAKYISTETPSAGSDGDVWYQVTS